MFSIKDIENLSGIKAHTIRIWEQRYSFIKPKRTDTNIRFYTNEELKTILNISLLNKYGYKISHINKMDASVINEKVLTLNQPPASQERIINDLLQHMIDLDMVSFEKELDNYIIAKGIEKSISHLIFPFLEKIGILWTTNHINVGQEHLVSNIIRQKLILGIENAKSFVRINKTVFLFLPENEYHELSLLFVHFLLKSHGVKIIYGGANLPMRDVEYIGRHTKPDIVYTHLTSATNNFNIEKMVNSLKNKLPDIRILISGKLINSYKKALPEGVHIKKSFSEVLEYIAKL